jgi:hypothetical protein
MPPFMKTCPKCGRIHDVAFVICGDCGTPLPGQSADEVVAAWFDGEHTMFDMVHDSPEVAWSAILRILERDLTTEQISLLAAGPLESLLAMHGSQFIDRVEREAKQNQRFNHLLGGVWQNNMSQEIWQRVQAARREKW